MKKKVFYVVALACALGLTAGSARAQGGKPSVIVFTVQNLGDGSAACGGFGLSFDMESPAGAPLGNGLSCVSSIEGCSFLAGCHDTVSATFTLDFGRGSLTAPVVLSEHWLSDTTALQLDTGTIVSGTGDFVGASGSIDCRGTVEFTATGAAIPKLVCVVRVS